MSSILATTLAQLLATFAHNWPFLVVGTVVAAALKVYSNQVAIAQFFRRRGAASVVLATLAAVATPLCSCGTMAVILGMMASSVPWAPIVAFMAASPITSPEETVVSAGLFGWPLALTLLGASVLIGLAAGTAAHFLEARGWLDGQARVRPANGGSAHGATALPALPAAACASSATRCTVPTQVAFGGSACTDCGASAAVALAAPSPIRLELGERLRALRLDRFRDELLRGGARLLFMFGAFAFVGCTSRKVCRWNGV